MQPLPLSLFVLLVSSVASAASISDLTQWTQIEDPPHPNVSTLSSTSSQVLLRAEGSVPSGVDIGFASINGTNVVGSTSGYYFDPLSDFRVAIDVRLDFAASQGAGAIGFGIGEDTHGRNSAGLVLGFANGNAIAMAAVARADDVDQPPQLLSNVSNVGTIYLNYIAATGDLDVGFTPGRSEKNLEGSQQVTLDGVQNSWHDEPLILSFFLRSQSIGTPPLAFPELTSGTVDATFQQLRLLSGTPLTIPEPTTALLAILGALGVLAVNRAQR